MFSGSHEFYVLDEHPEMNSSWELMRRGQLSVDGADMGMMIQVVMVDVVVEYYGEVPECIFHQLKSAFVEDIRSILQDRSGLQELLHVFVELFSVEKEAESLRAERGATALLLKNLFHEG